MRFDMGRPGPPAKKSRDVNLLPSQRSDHSGADSGLLLQNGDLEAEQVVDWRRDTVAPPQLRDGTGEDLDLRLAAGLHVLEHRALSTGIEPGNDGEDAFRVVGREPHPLRSGDRHHLGGRAPDELANLGWPKAPKGIRSTAETWFTPTFSMNLNHCSWRMSAGTTEGIPARSNNALTATTRGSAGSFDGAPKTSRPMLA